MPQAEPYPDEQTPDGIVLRPLADDDAEAYARLFIGIWRETYDGLMPAERLSALELGPVADRTRRMLADPDLPPTIGALRDGALIGWARAGDPRDDDAPHDVELWSLNVARSVRGTGLAPRLMESALRSHAAYLWVVEGNERARRFYRRQGFVEDGARRWEENDRTHEVRMVRPAGTAGVLDGRYLLRPLTIDDASAIGPLHVTIWRQTYERLMPAEALAALDVDQRVTMWQRWLADDASPEALGAFDTTSGDLVGWVTVGRPRDDDAPAPEELWVLNIERTHQGSGLAHVMLERALGERPAYLWVVEGNDRAIAFYRRHGFELDGKREVQDEGNADLRMVRPARVR